MSLAIRFINKLHSRKDVKESVDVLVLGTVEGFGRED